MNFNGPIILDFVQASIVCAFVVTVNSLKKNKTVNELKLRGKQTEKLVKTLKMKDRCPKSVGDAKQTLEIRVEPGGAARDNGNEIYFSSCTYKYVGAR